MTTVVRFKEWVKRNQEALNREWDAYRYRHDYSLDGTYFGTFEAWSYNEYQIFLMHNALDGNSIVGGSKRVDVSNALNDIFKRK